MIEITLTFHDKHIDLLIPGEVTLDRLRQLIGEAFAAKGTLLPTGFSLEFQGKALALSGADLVSAFGVGNGDQLLITIDK